MTVGEGDIKGGDEDDDDEEDKDKDEEDEDEEDKDEEEEETEVQLPGVSLVLGLNGFDLEVPLCIFPSSTASGSSRLLVCVVV